MTISLPIPADLPLEAHALWAETVELLDREYRQPDAYVLRAMCDAWVTAEEARRVIEREGIISVGHKGQVIQAPSVRIHGAAQDRFLRLRQSVRASPVRPDAPEPMPNWRSWTTEEDWVKLSERERFDLLASLYDDEREEAWELMGTAVPMMAIPNPRKAARNTGLPPNPRPTPKRKPSTRSKSG